MSETSKNPNSSGERQADEVLKEVGDLPIVAEQNEPSGGGEPPTYSRAPKARRTRKIFSGVFVVLFCISLLVTVLSVWSVRQVLNTNAFAGHVEVALKSPAVQTELSNYGRRGGRSGGGCPRKSWPLTCRRRPNPLPALLPAALTPSSPGRQTSWSPIQRSSRLS